MHFWWAKGACGSARLKRNITFLAFWQMLLFFSIFLHFSPKKCIFAGEKAPAAAPAGEMEYVIIWYYYMILILYYAYYAYIITWYYIIYEVCNWTAHFVLYDVVSDMMLVCIVLCYFVMYFAVLYYVMLYCIMLFCVALL